MAVIKYTEKVLEHFKNPHNVGELENPDGAATVGSPACGDQVSVFLKVEHDKIQDISFLSYGCASNIATGSIVTDLAKGLLVEDAKKLTWKDAVDKLGGLPPVKVHCSVLAVDGLRAAIQDYEKKHLGISHDRAVDESFLLDELKKVIHPASGVNIIDAKLVKYLRFQGEGDEKPGLVEIEISLEETDPYRHNVLEEIHEHLEAIPQVKEIDVKVVEY